MSQSLHAPRGAPPGGRTRHLGLVLFDGVDALDTVGPVDVLTSWTQRHPEDGWAVSCLSAGGGPVVAAQDLVLAAHRAWDRAPRLDVLLHPGGPGTRRLLEDPAHLQWVRAQRARVPLLVAVGTGAVVFAAAGLLTGRCATTHWASLNLLSELDPTIVPDVDARFVDDGDLVTSAGVGAGIDVALHLVVRLAGADRAREVRRHLQYDPRPPV